MPIYAKAAVLAIACAITLGTGHAAASRSLNLSPSGAMRLSSRALTFTTSTLYMICDLTLTGSLNRSISKAELTVAGRVSEARWSACTGRIGEGERESYWTGEAEITQLNLGMPWTIRYKSFLGTLPNISGVRLQIVEAGFLWSLGTRNGTIRCLWRGNVELLADVTRGSVSALRVLAPNSLPLIVDLSRLFLSPCPESFEFLGILTLSPTQAVTLA